MASTDAEKAGTLVGAYSKVFCWDDPASVPVMNPQYDGPLLEELQVTPDQVQAKLCYLCPAASPGPDTIHPKVLRELAAPRCRPLADLCNKVCHHETFFLGSSKKFSLAHAQTKMIGV